jgi:hypothetical protein
MQHVAGCYMRDVMSVGRRGTDKITTLQETFTACYFLVFQELIVQDGPLASLSEFLDHTHN